MPIVKIAGKLVYYGHIPKCGGSAVESYLHARFGGMAMLDTKYMSLPEKHRWSKTSPQHIDVASLRRLFPPGFFDLSFSVVRHPVERLVSVFHFQRDVEKLIPHDMNFSGWLTHIQTRMQDDPFHLDNHLRPMAELVPEEAKLFHLEHGLDSLIPWFDEIAGDQKQPRCMPLSNERGAYSKVKIEKVEPGSKDIDVICRIYAADFSRFGYQPGRKQPSAARPTGSDGLKVNRPVGHAQAGLLFSKTINRVRKRIGM